MNPHKQLILNLRDHVEARLSDFAGESYSLLRQAATHFVVQKEPLFYLHGEKGSGRSHFMLALCAEVEAQGRQALWLPFAELGQDIPAVLQSLEEPMLVACDDIDVLVGQVEWEEAFFHFFNRMRGLGGQLAFSARVPPTQLGFTLPDNVSRVAQAPSWYLELPTDESRRALLVVLAQRRGLVLEKGVVDWLIRWAPRQPAALMALMDKADYASLREGKRLTIPFLKGLFVTQELLE